MSKKPKRRWFRFHLMTAVLMMVAAGGLIGQNAVIRETVEEYRIVNGFGWPFIFRPTFIREFDDPNPERYGYDLNLWHLSLNTLLLVSILLCVALISESILRRREGRRP
jgi:hypothetical protein